jgi:phosphoglycerate kinase
MSKDRRYKTLDDFDFKNKTVILRIDINSPIDEKTGEILDESRFIEHSITVNELLEKGAKIIILAHQGRKGDKDFTNFEKHARILSKYVKGKVKYVPDILGEKALKEIKNLKSGEALLLENIRMMDEETEEKDPLEHSKGEIVSKLAPLAQIYVNDAFAAAHRAHASTVGFIPILPTAIGRIMERELKALEKIVDNPEKPCIYIVGGAKPKESFNVIKYILEKDIADLVLTGGIIAQVFLKVSNINLGNENEKIIEKLGFKPLMPKAEEIINKYKDKIVTPIDFGIEVDGERENIMIHELPTNYIIKDIGTYTIKLYSYIIRLAKAIVMNGPLGIFEEKNFSYGTFEIFKAVGKSKAFSVLGGGHTIAALKKSGLEKNFSYVSTAGGALISYISGEKMPVIEALKKYS